jgi:acetyl esterase/lipase
MRPRHPHAAESGVGKHTARESERVQACAAGKERVTNAHPHKLAPEAARLPEPFSFSRFAIRTARIADRTDACCSQARGRTPAIRKTELPRVSPDGLCSLMPRRRPLALTTVILAFHSVVLLDLAAAETTAVPYPLVLGPIRLWEGDAPGALGKRPQDIPTLTPYPASASKQTGATMLIFPGGGYGNLAAHEGTGYAEWFAANGINAYVLKYRLGSNGYRHPVMLNDAARALRMVRAFAKRDGHDPARIGIIGSSAGGHLAATLATHFDSTQPEGPKLDAGDAYDRESSRPDLAILCYPVISLAEFAHAGSRKNLLGENPSPAQLQNLSNELQVTKDTPPTFLWHTVEDKAVPVENSLLFAAAMRRAGVPFSLHIYENGAHGLGLGRPDRPAPPWADQLLYWFKERKFTR